MNPDAPGAPPPGWYPDPAGVRAWRWWDGYRWTGYASDPVAAGPGGPARAPVDGGVGGGFAPVPESLAAEERLARWARPAFLGFVVVVGLFLLTVRAEGGWARSLYDQLRTQLRRPAGTRLHIHAPLPPHLVLTQDVTIVIEAGVYLGILLWQFRAARTARLLGLPARHSPGWGVGSWFVPVVNFWIPYQALRDCLPSDDPGRHTVLRMWLCFLGQSAAQTATVGLALFGSAAGWPVAAAALALAVGFSVGGTRTVTRIGETHRRLAEGRLTSSVSAPLPGP